MAKPKNYDIDGPCKYWKKGGPTCRFAQGGGHHMSCPQYHQTRPIRWFLFCHKGVKKGELDEILGI